MNCSLSPTATLYKLGLEGMADQKPVELVPMVTVVVAALSVRAEMSSADASSAASAERMTSAKRKDRMRSVGVSSARMPCPPLAAKVARGDYCGSTPGDQQNPAEAGAPKMRKVAMCF